MLRLTLSTRLVLALAMPATLLACQDESGTAPPAPSSADGEATATISWNRAAREILAALPPQQANPVVQARVFAYLSIAQHNALVEAERVRSSNNSPSPAAAVTGASEAVLKALLPAAQSDINTRLAAQLAAPRFAGETQADVDAGLAIGRTIATAVNAWAAADGTNQTQPTPNPGGPGNWRGTNPVLGLFGARLMALESANQFLPTPPPAFGSPAFETALAEARTVAQNRSAAQVATATFWHPRNGAAMNETAVEIITANRRTERDAARILATANMAGFDIMNACFAAKMTYWYIRPSQADPTITFIPGVPLPNHPSYPSGHSCITATYSAVLEREFPSERTRLTSLVTESGFSRIVAGFHYRFDIEAGERLGRAVGEWTSTRGARLGTPIALR